MKDGKKTKAQLIDELVALRRRNAELEQLDTEGKRVEEALRDSRKMLQTVLDSIPSAVFWKDRHSFYLGGNRTWLEAAGLKSSEEVVGKTDYDLPWEEKQADSFREDDRRVMESGIPEYNIIEPYHRADGTHAWARTNKVPLRDIEDHVVGILGTYEDITERVQTEEKLRESKERLELAVRGAGLGLWDWNIQTGAVSRNEEWANMLGYSFEEVEPHASFWEKLMHPDDRERVEKAWSEHLGGKALFYEVEHRLRTRSGDWKWILDSGKIVEWDDEGKPLRAAGLHRDITDRKKAIEDLERIFNLSTLMVCITDIKGYFRKVSPAFAAILGYSEDELQSKSFLDFVHPQDQQSTLNVIRNKLEKGVEVVAFENRYRCKDGSYKRFAWTSKPVLEEGITFVSAYDITERKRAEEALRKSQESLARAQQIGHLGNWDWDIKNRTLNWSNEVYDIFGVDKNFPLTYERIKAMIYPDDCEKERAKVNELLHTADAVEFELRIIRPDGEVRYIYQNAEASRDEAGNVRRIFGIIQDITERKRVEETLRESEERFSKAFHSSANLIAITTYPDGKIIDVNETWIHQTGFSREEAVGHTAIELGLWVNPSDREVCLCNLIERGRIRDFEVMLRTKRETMTCLISGEFIEIRGKRHVLWEFRDITERKRAEEALRHSLEETNRSQRLLLALNQAAQAVQRVRTPGEIYRVVGYEILRLGYHCTIFSVTEDWKNLALEYMTFKNTTRRLAEKLTGLSARGYRFPLEPGGRFQQIMHEKKSVFIESITDLISEALPEPVRPLAGRLANVLKMHCGIYTPLIIEGLEPHLLWVTGADLRESDVPAVAAFACQASIALENARLFNEVETGRVQLRFLTRRLVSSQEKERKLIAQELHDELGQTLTALSINLDTMKTDVPATLRETLIDILDDSIMLTDRLHDQLDEIILRLRPTMLDDLGLVQTLNWYINEYRKRTKINVHLQIENVEQEFSGEIESNVYRIVQEAMTNIARHARAHNVNVRFSQRENKLTLFIEDDGIGFDMENLNLQEIDKRGMGLLGMRERVEFLGGEINIITRPGAGTTIALSIPLGKTL